MKLALVYKNLKASNANISHTGLGVTAENTRLSLTAKGIYAETWAVIDGYHLQQILAKRPDITHVDLLAPWMDSAFMDRGLVRRFPKVHFALTSHSNVGFLQADTWAVKIIREGLALQHKYPNFVISGNCIKFCNWVKAAYGFDIVCLPNLYYLDIIAPPKRPLFTKGTLKLGIFGATRVQKNMMSAAAAALVLSRLTAADHTEIWVSSGRTEGGAGVMASVLAMVSNIPRVKIVESGWLTWLDFRVLCGQMHLMLQPSYTESFNNVTADGIYMGTPSVVSNAIDWVPDYWQAHADDPVHIARTGLDLLRNPKAPADGFKALQHHNALALPAWLSFLQR